MRIGLGVLRLRPDDFWAMSLIEFFAATDGYLDSKGVRRKGGPSGAPSKAETDALFAQFDAEGRPLTHG
jgi:uncharacterized phage protein (TIGR02216 family)